ncbi:uncharacterized protein PV07_12163 [Cladophialophora immunda]|uniref:Uncharacterized protein n=1 Tax=Cladophialophora immunda TaxID=569365 RepID=A0A0D2CFA4_9EURO|nr:uncharacterized protein PV07_12163 [Cladophialophora immunda]KIW22259.1 hypothetical protein PV07_12163 [Cladophialophora immunda]
MFSAGFSTAKTPEMSRNTAKYPRPTLVEEGHPPAKNPAQPEEYERIQRKQRAEAILAQYDILMKYAVENNLSIPQTRQYFRKVALEIPTEPVIKNWFPS